MAVIRPFQGVRPAKELASSIAALPYDVYDREEAREVVDKNPLSFLKIDRAETQFAPDTDMYSQPVYDLSLIHIFSLDKAACINVSFSTSRLAVASSSKMIGEFLRKARAIEIRCLSPPESSQPFSPIMLL